MVKTTFFVHCRGWKDGGYPNTHYHTNEAEARAVIDGWNAQYKANGNDAWVSIISIEPVTDEEFLEDYCGID